MNIHGERSLSLSTLSDDNPRRKMQKHYRSSINAHNNEESQNNYSRKVSQEEINKKVHGINITGPSENDRSSQGARDNEDIAQYMGQQAKLKHDLSAGQSLYR